MQRSNHAATSPREVTLSEIWRFGLDNQLLKTVSGTSVTARSPSDLFQGLWGSQEGPQPRRKTKAPGGQRSCFLVGDAIS